MDDEIANVMIHLKSLLERTADGTAEYDALMGALAELERVPRWLDIGERLEVGEAVYGVLQR
jgi:hypothetical protein